MKGTDSEPDSRAGLYERSVDPAGEDSLAKLVRWIRPGSTVLDVGTAGGALGEYLSRRLNCTADGVERDLGAAALARRHYRRLVVADLERSDLGDIFPAGAYDYVVCADVLEHLREPGKVLASARGLLRPGGHLLVSIPNIGFAPFLAELLGGQWRYRPVGLLDETHLRFVTRDSLEEMLGEAGFSVAAWERVVKPAHESEFGTVYLEALPPAVRLFLDHLPEAGTYQFIVDAVEEPDQGARADLPAVPQRRPLPLSFVARVFWRSEGSSYAEERQVRALGEIGAGLQTLRFDLPPVGRLGGLLLEPADRETILDLQGLRVYGPETLVWTWDGSLEELRRAGHDRLTLVEREAGMGLQLVIHAREGRLELPLGTGDLARCDQGCRVEADLSWPLSPDYLRALDRLQGSFTEQAAAEQEATALLAERDRLGALLDERLRLLQETEEARHLAVAERDRAVVLLDERLALLEDVTRQARELTVERDRAVELLDERLALVQALTRQVAELEAERLQQRGIVAQGEKGPG